MAKKTNSKRVGKKKKVPTKTKAPVGDCPCGSKHERRSPYCSKKCYEKFDPHGSYARAQRAKELK